VDENEGIIYAACQVNKREREREREREKKRPEGRKYSRVG